MNYAQQLRVSNGHRAGLAIVVTLHVLLGWALLHVVARTAVDVIKPPVDIDIVKEVERTPPPPLPNLPQPKSELPTPVIVSLPDIPQMARDSESVITSPPEATPHDSSRSGGSTSESLPPIVAPRAVAKPAIANVQACAPGSEDYPAAARRVEATGLTRLRFTIDAAGALVRSEVVKSAGVSREHRLLDKVAESKLAGCYFTAGVDENGRAMGGTFEVDYVWKLE